MRLAPLPGLTAACLLLAGCSTPPAPPPPVAKRLALSQAQETAIKAGIAPSLKDIQNPAFPLLAAATEPDGAIFVCGTAKPDAGSYQLVTPFALLMRGPQITVLAVGGNDRDNLAVKNLCSSKGIDGLSGLANGEKSGWLSSMLSR